MQTPVFLDHLPDIDAVTGQKSAQYRLSRNKALLELQLDSATTWQTRATCPACGQDSTRSRSFSQTLLEFQRCSSCNSIYAARVPEQSTLDRLRLAQLETTTADTTAGTDADTPDHAFEFISLLNWISLTEARLERPLDRVLDVRFSTQSPAWVDATKRLSRNRQWAFLGLSPESETFDGMKAAIAEAAPTAILIPAEMDRIANPAAFLGAIKEAAAPGTVLFVASSCADGLEYEILGADSPSFVPLDRLTVFSIKGLENLAATLGFNVLEISTPGRLDAVILGRYFKSAENTDLPFWSSFFREADKNRLRDLQILLQRSLKSGVLRFVLEV